MDKLCIKGAREHNLRDLEIELPRDKLIVFTGVSGSGKSSLAFDTIYAEGQRRYVESLSTYARQFLGRLDKPDVDYIEGLSPTISIEQKTTSRNPRSTVGTITEIYDYLRLLFARIGVPHHPLTGKPLKRQALDEIVEQVTHYPTGTKIMLISPVVRSRKGEHIKLLQDAAKNGFTRAIVDGDTVDITKKIPKLHKNKKHSIGIVVDRIVVEPEERTRIAEGVELALNMSEGFVDVQKLEGSEAVPHSFSLYYAYTTDQGEFAFPELEPRFFSFNSPSGACPKCHGIGEIQQFDINRIMPDDSLSFNEGALLPFNPNARWYRSIFTGIANALGFSLDTPFAQLPAGVVEQIFHGTIKPVAIHYVNKTGSLNYTKNEPYIGVIKELQRRYRETSSQGMKQWFEQFMSVGVCTECNGKRLKKEALAVQVHGKNIDEVSTFTIHDAVAFFDEARYSANERDICIEVIREIHSRLSFLMNVGLGYIALNRKANTLSGGESQRIRLASQIGSSLVGVMYVLDEPTIGLHQRDNDRLLATLTHLRDLGNTLIVVEHDEQTIRSADYVLELGPGAGIHGGTVVAHGPLKQILTQKRSLTARFLNDAMPLVIDKQRVPSSMRISVSGVTHNNLKNVAVDFPLRSLVLITGVSGSGKSSLMNGVIYPALTNIMYGSDRVAGSYKQIDGYDAINKVVQIDQSPIGRTPRSNPATYVKFFDEIRNLFSQLPKSKERGYKSGRFSFNVPGGRCEECQGGGTIKIEMHFLSDVYVTCSTCKGKRFNAETLEVRYKGKNIYDVLQMTVDEAAGFFSAIPKISRHLQTLQMVGLGYIALGQSALTFSGGEAQRIKLSTELAKRDTGDTLYFLDEPSTGLHHADVIKLMTVIESLVAKGNTVIIIEHNLDIIAQADYIVDLGPEGGDEGGKIVATGTPQEVARTNTHTGVFLRQHLSTHTT